MKFEEMMKRYVSGQLSTEEEAYVKSEIEKYEAISEYLYDKEMGDDSFLQPEPQMDEESKNQEENKVVMLINRSIQRAFLKMGCVVLAITLAIVLFCIYGLSPLISSFYYNPKKEVGELTNQISLDYAVYSELSMPGTRIDNVVVEEKGFGNYNFTFYQQDVRPDELVSIAGEIEKGKLTFYNENLLESLHDISEANLFVNMGKVGIVAGSDTGEVITDLKESPSKKEDLKQMVEELEDDTVYRGYLAFEGDLSFEEMTSFFTQGSVRYPEWIGIRTDPDNRYNLGYAMNQGGKVLRGWDKKRYPELLSITEDGRLKSMEQEVLNEEWCLQHFQSMLRYMEDQEAFRKLIQDEKDYRTMREYIEKNGLNCYGMVIETNKEELLRLIEDERVSSLNLEVKY